MVVTTWNDLAGGRAAIRGPAALTIGTFDGVHRGHREILRRLAECADRDRPGGGAHRVVLTFRQHPRSVLTRQHPGTLTTLRQRRERFAALGVTHLVLIDFSAQFSKLSGREFIGALLRGMSLRKLVVGVDFRCGRGRDTDVVELQRLLAPAGVHVVVVPPVVVNDNIDSSNGVVSSTRIRALVRAGDFAATREMMGVPYEVDLCDTVRAVPDGGSAVDRGAVPDQGRVSDRGTVSDQRTVFNHWYVATEQLEQILPQPGIYAASVAVTGGGTVASEVEVMPDGVRCELPTGVDCVPLALRFHRRVAAHRREHPISADGVTIASRIASRVQE